LQQQIPETKFSSFKDSKIGARWFGLDESKDTISSRNCEKAMLEAQNQRMNGTNDIVAVGQRMLRTDWKRCERMKRTVIRGKSDFQDPPGESSAVITVTNSLACDCDFRIHSGDAKVWTSLKDE
jgi:hypothetical protein